MQASLPIYEPLSAVAGQGDATPPCTLTLQLPRFHNPDERGRRRKCAISTLKFTLREMRQMFSGYCVTTTKGWNRDDRIRDSHYRFEIDFVATPNRLESIRAWKLSLEDRFEQRSIYMKLSDGTIWL